MESSEFVLKSSREYALYVCENRAIPSIIDGLKQVQRMILWTLRNRDEKIKTVALTGLLSYTKLYVHGDMPCNEAISQLAAPYKNNVCLIEGHGAFGNRLYPDSWGQARYTEVKRAKISEALLYQDLDIVPLEDNYDGSNKQPKHFLPLIPLVLLNGIAGIAVGWSTHILPRNLKTLITATKAVITGDSIPDLSPSYTNYNCSIENIGPNKWEISGKVKIEGNTAYITELPPGMNIETFRKRLIEMENEDQIKSFIDKSTDTINIVVKLKYISPISNEKQITNKDAIEFFKLRERVTERIVVLDWEKSAIKTYDNPIDIVKDFVEWRLKWYTKRFEYNIKRDEYELRYWQALQILFAKNFSKKLGKFSDKSAMQTDIAETLLPKLVLDVSQMDRIINLATYKWTIEFATEIDKKIIDLQTAIVAYNEILKSPKKLRDVYLKELSELKV